MIEIQDNVWMQVIQKYNRPDARRSWFQLISNLILYSAGYALMIWSLSVSYWLTLLLAFPVAGIMVRLFIIFHDCGHGSFFKSGRLRKIVGFITGTLTFTPYTSWTNSHGIHHKTAGNLDKRGVGDVWTLTVKEYMGSKQWDRLKYRIYRHPITMFGVGSILAFVILNRFTRKDMNSAQRMGVYITNAGLLVLTVGMSLLIGLQSFLLIQLPLIHIAGILGFWLFYVQHQFDPSYWSHSDTWDYRKVALEGSSFYNLPAVFRWFTGSIGYHHIHHLSPMIPNYNLRRCHNENEMFRKIKPLSFKRSLMSLRFRLWDEDHGRMIGFREVKD